MLFNSYGRLILFTASSTHGTRSLLLDTNASLHIIKILLNTSWLTLIQTSIPTTHAAPITSTAHATHFVPRPTTHYFPLLTLLPAWLSMALDVVPSVHTAVNTLVFKFTYHLYIYHQWHFPHDVHHIVCMKNINDSEMKTLVFKSVCKNSPLQKIYKSH